MFLKSKTVVITGASSGIGRACAAEFARRGANLVLAARQYVTLCEITAALEKEFSIKAIAVQCDVSREEDCKLLVEQANHNFGQIDVLVNNAGISMRAIFNDLDLIVIRNLMEVNFWGTIYCTKYALPELLKARGSVVGISSIAGFRGLPGRSGYAASKFAMNGFLESLRVENLKNGLHVMIAAPGFTTSNIRNTALSKDGQAYGETNMEEGKLMSAEKVATIIVEGVINRRRTIIMTAQGKFAVLMNKFVPAWVDKKVFALFARERNPLIK